MKLPDGFGSLRSDEPLSVTAQVLSHNYHGADPRAAACHRALRPGSRPQVAPRAHQRGINTLVGLDGPGGAYNTEVAEVGMHDHAAAEGIGADSVPYHDHEGRTFARPHWVVKPGREVRTTPINGWLDMRRTSRSITSRCIYPFAESLQLRDVTTGQTVLASQAENRPERIGLARVDQISSAQGITPQGPHLRAGDAYNNTTNGNRTAMAVMYLYVEDTEFRRP